jgi:hypothetical protein
VGAFFDRQGRPLRLGGPEQAGIGAARARLLKNGLGPGGDRARQHGRNRPGDEGSRPKAGWAATPRQVPQSESAPIPAAGSYRRRLSQSIGPMHGPSTVRVRVRPMWSGLTLAASGWGLH